MRVLVDTGYPIEVEKRRAELPRAQVIISWITLYELIRGGSDYSERKASWKNRSSWRTRRTTYC
jgi:predicted nucleic acid-binding protein